MTKTRGFELVREDMRRTSGEPTLPTRGTSKAMAYDFYANDNYTVQPNAIAKYGLMLKHIWAAMSV